jgi:hypothetical protein
MAKAPNTTRRAFLSASGKAAASAAAVSVLAGCAIAPAFAEPEFVGMALARHHARKLAEAMVGPEFAHIDGFTITVAANSPDQPLWLGKDVAPKPSPEGRFKLAVAELKAAAQELDPTIGRLWVCRDQDVDMEAYPRGRLSFIGFDRSAQGRK